MLTQQQLDKIANYCKAMGVKYYDVELELVDHIADMIEHLQQTNSVLDFDDALRISTQQFAAGEFFKIVKNKEQQLRTRFKRLLQKEFFAYFTFPKLLLTLCLFATMAFVDSQKILNNLSNTQLNIPYSICFFIFIFLKQNGTIVNKQRRLKHIIDRATLPLLVYNVLLRRNKIISMIPIIWFAIIGFVSNVFIKNVVNEALKNALLLYSFPLFFIFCLAWKKVFIGQTKLMQKQYATAFEN